MSNSSSLTSRLGPVIADVLTRREEGEHVDEQEYLQRYPELADPLSSFFGWYREMNSALGIPEPAEPGESAEAIGKNDQTVAFGQGQVTPKAASRDEPFSDSAPQDPNSAAPAVPDANVFTRPWSSQSGISEWSWGRIQQAQFPLEFGPYVLLEEIDRGGMGVVYRAEDRPLKRIVALKVMRAGEMATGEEVWRFRTEAVAAAALKHPNITQIYDWGEQHGLFYFTMHYVQGVDLDKYLKRQVMPFYELAEIMAKIATAVDCAHRQDIVHRDIKPSNILLDAEHEPFLADFGLAHCQAANDGLTKTGQLLGTPAYMAPEQACGKAPALSPGIDIYALGAVLYTGLTRQPPFIGPTPFDVIMQVMDRQPPKPTQIDRRVPRPLEAICLKAMSKESGGRYQSAGQMAEDLRRYQRGEPVQIPAPTFGDRLRTWWRREPILVSHLGALLTVLLIMMIACVSRHADPWNGRFLLKLGMVAGWGSLSYGLQRLLRFDYHRQKLYLVWATADVVIYTALMILADPPRGLLLVGYPMMIAATALFYRVRFVSYMTALCIAGVLLVARVVDDPLTERLDFLGIYISGLIVLAMCVVTMIRRVRGLSLYCGASE